MDFSLSRRAFSRALGRNGNLFGFLVLVVLSNFIRGTLYSGASVRSAIRAVLVHQETRKPVQWNDLVRVTFLNRRARHSTHDASILALRDGHSARSLNCA